MEKNTILSDILNRIKKSKYVRKALSLLLLPFNFSCKETQPYNTQSLQLSK